MLGHGSLLRALWVYFGTPLQITKNYNKSVVLCKREWHLQTNIQYPNEDNASANKNLQHPYGNSNNKNTIVIIFMSILMILLTLCNLVKVMKNSWFLW